MAPAGVCTLCAGSPASISTLRSPYLRVGGFSFFTDLGMVYNLISFIGMSPSGKASGFGPDTRGFESLHPNQKMN